MSKSQRPVDLAREHGLSAQAIRNYEADGVLPAAPRTASGYRVYTERHAAALRAFLALVPAFGHATARTIMRAIVRGEIDAALRTIDAGHALLLRDRETLDSVEIAVPVAAETPPPGRGNLQIGELAHRIGVTPATLRTWEVAGILTPSRDRTGQRVYGADDVRDAQLAHLLRRGGYRLDHIATVAARVRASGGTEALADSLAQWRERLTARGRAMLTAAARVDELLSRSPAEGSPRP
ncbi:DNA-binding transcriptional MerR regulator [Catenuloplanes atrovinosus]|uniref:DNA-binding transcriptional MerR regulator n=1 Tax=Catenuloplanes atrovinosus TaxID=137266 RepID=A0AAE4C8B4_9ACTN|nr:DNA-binding transcriptional MerR regulator [Catenuloplanes atrovinosus]